MIRAATRGYYGPCPLGQHQNSLWADKAHDPSGLGCNNIPFEVLGRKLSQVYMNFPHLTRHPKRELFFGIRKIYSDEYRFIRSLPVLPGQESRCAPQRLTDNEMVGQC